MKRLGTRINTGTIVIALVTSALVVLLVNHFVKELALLNAEEEAVLLLQNNLATHTYLNKRLKPAVFALSDAVRSKEYFDPAWMSSTYAVREITKFYRSGTKGRYYYKEAAINARSPENEADEWERTFISRLNADPALTRDSGVRTIDGKPFFVTLIRGETMEEECLRCHSTPSSAPGELVRTYGSTRSFDRASGEVVSAISIRIPLDEAYRRADQFSLKVCGALLLMLVAMFVVHTRMIGSLVLAPLQRVRSKVQLVASDPSCLGTSIPSESSWEMNDIVSAFNSMSGRLKTHLEGLEEQIEVRTVELRESEMRYRLLFENMTTPCALAAVEMDGSGETAVFRLVEVNPAFENLTGMPEGKLLGKSVQQAVPGMAHLWEEAWRGFSNGVVAVEGAALDRHWQVQGFAPQPSRFALLLSDVTEGKRLEKVMADRVAALTNPLFTDDDLSFDMLFNVEEIQRIQDAFAAATGVASLITDAAGRPITRPSNFCRLCLDIIRKTEKGNHNCRISDATIGRHHAKGPIVQPCLSGGLLDGGAPIMAGDTHVASWLIGQVLDEGADEEGMVSYAREIGADVAEYQRALNEVPRMPRERFEKICETLYLLAGQLSQQALFNLQQARYIWRSKQAEEAQRKLQAQLHHSQKMEAVGRLAGGVAHDFNNKLTVISGYAELSQLMAEEGSPLWNNLVEILRAAEHSREIAAQLLTFSRRQLITPQPFDANRGISQAQKSLRRLIGEDITFTFVPADDLWPIRIDPVQMDQIVINMAVNARDAMPAGGAFVIETSNVALPRHSSRGAAELELPPGDYVAISFSDTGVGMDSETMSHIFDPFFTTKDVGKGTGLGLATIYGIVSQNNGVIEVASAVGKGTLFEVLFPRFDGEVVEEMPATGEEYAGGGTVLLVEDEEPVRNLTSLMLQQLGYEVVASANPQEAAEIVHRNPRAVDLLLTDVIMPQMTGRKLVEQVHRIRPDMPVIFMSGYTADLIGRKGALEDGADYLQKPFDLAALREKLGSVFRTHTYARP